MSIVRHTSSAAVAAAMAITFAACSGTSSSLAPSSTTAAGSAAVSTGFEAPSPAGGSGVSGGSALSNAQLAALRNVTAPFHDVSAAVAAGYPAPEAGACVASPAGAMGFHSVNLPLVMQPGVVAETPEVLLYIPKNGGGFRLVGVEYFEPVIVRSPAGQVGPWVDPGPWPSGYTVVNQRPALFGQPFNGPMAGHEPGMPWHWDLHVWIWQANPAGMFAQFNPSLSCP